MSVVRERKPFGAPFTSELTAEAVDRIVAVALAEDVGDGDRTTATVVPASARCRAGLLLREAGVVCGLNAAAAVFGALDPELVFEPLLDEGARVAAPTPVARLEGSARAVLTGERTALNLLGRLSGIATLTARYVDLVEGTGAAILDTRKTTPGLRALERYAVRCGGGTNHRSGLYDAVLLKENHLRIAGGVRAAVEALGAPGVPVEVEAESLQEVSEALDAGVDRILLDNMSVEEVARAVEVVGGRVPLEASGGITLGNVRAYAETGVDFISVGALTHSTRSLDVSLEVE
jgi:nicotinate-nucleotide pyrophosphorylase (carboxylating)